MVRRTSRTSRTGVPTGALNRLDAHSPVCALAWLVAAGVLLGGVLPGAAQAQASGAAGAPVLSSPLPAGANGQPAVAGTGPGYHSPNSPIAPLPVRGDVVPWSVLSDLKKNTTKTAVLPVFNAQQQAMHQTMQRIQGFMVPMDAKPTQKHFLLTSVPLTCSFCIPGGPESMVEVKAKTPVRYSLEPVVVEGKFNVLPNDPYGLFYRMVEAEPVK